LASNLLLVKVQKTMQYSPNEYSPRGYHSPQTEVLGSGPKMSKKLFLLVVLAIALSAPAFADSDTVFNPDVHTGVGLSWGVPGGALFAGVFSQLRAPGLDLGGDHFFTELMGGREGFFQPPRRFPLFNPHPGPGGFCQAVPEPGELSLIVVGLLGLVGTIRRRYTR
jgi:hypothetical protein